MKTFVDDLVKDDHATGRSTLGNDNGFTILEDRDVYIYRDSIATTYTLTIQKEDKEPNSFSNLIVKFKNDHTTTVSIINYFPTQGCLNCFEKDARTPFEGEATYKQLEYDGSLDGLHSRWGCTNITVRYCNYGGETHCAGENCTLSYTWIENFTICSTSSTIDAPAGDPKTGGGGSPSTSEGGGTKGTPTAPQIPVCAIGKVFNTDTQQCECENGSENWDCEEDQIINRLTGKADCVFKKLNSSSTGFKNMIKKFDGKFPVAHLRLKVDDIGNRRGQTEAPIGNAGNTPDYVITITMNNNSSIHGVGYRPNLLVVKTIAYEVIHAEMYRKLMSILNNGSNLSGVPVQDVVYALSNGDYPRIYDYYRNHRNWQHQQMADHYRESLARILQKYDTGVSVANNMKLDQLYMDLAWEGLDKSTIKAWTDLSTQEQNRIRTVKSNYINKNQKCK